MEGAYQSFGEAEPHEEADDAGQRREPAESGSERSTPGDRSARGAEHGGGWQRGPRWTEDEWDAWNAWWTRPPSTSERSSGETTRAQPPGNNSGPDPWWNAKGDPWAPGWGEESTAIPAGGGGGSDKITVPEFDGEEQSGHEGSRARGYLRKVNAWKRLTRIKPAKQALALYNHLSGKAWRDAEELDLDLLDQESGIDVFIGWISPKYLDKEVVKVGRCMSEFFKVLKRTNGQDIKDFNQEFDRQASRLKEVGRQLPDLCLAWWYMDKLRLDNASELSLLSSTGNVYSLQKLQEAAIIQDRMNRRMWETRRGGKEQRALVADHIDEEPDDEDDDDTEATTSFRMETRGPRRPIPLSWPFRRRRASIRRRSGRGVPIRTPLS